jgi:hypothetical protein
MAATANIKLLGTTSLAGADSSNDNALFVEARPPAMGQDGGAFSVAVPVSINLANWSSWPQTVAWFRWIHPFRTCLMQRVSIGMLLDTALTFTSGTPSLFFEACVCRNVLADPDSDVAGAPTAINLQGTHHDQKLRTSFSPTALSSATNSALAGTACVSVTTAGTMNWSPFNMGLGSQGSNWVSDIQHDGTLAGGLGAFDLNMNTQAAGTWPLGGLNAGLFRWLDYTGAGMTPFQLSRNTALSIFVNGGVTMTGTLQMVIQYEWMEVAAY